MRVLHFYKTYLPDTIGGIEHVINQIARSTAKQGVQTDVLSLTRQKTARSIEIDGHTAHRARMDFEIASTGISLSAFLRFAQLARQADVIHYHFPWPLMDMVHFVTRPDKPTLVTYHSDIIRQKNLLKLYTPLMNRFLASVDHIVATSPNYLETSDVLHRLANKVSVIPIGLDKASYPVPADDRLRYWRERLSGKFFLFIGVIRYYKGLHILLEAAQGTDYPIVIVGSGPIEQALRQQAAQLGLPHVQFLGQLSEEDKVALLMLCHGVVFPSHLRSEAFGVSLLEGAMYGKPLISSEIGTGTTFINIGGSTGLVVPPSNAEAFRQAMQFLWDHEPEARIMGQNAEARYQSLFTADRMGASYAQLYKQLAESYAGQSASPQPRAAMAPG